MIVIQNLTEDREPTSPSSSTHPQPLSPSPLEARDGVGFSHHNRVRKITRRTVPSTRSCIYHAKTTMPVTHSANGVETEPKPHQTISSLLLYFRNQTNSIHLLFHPNQPKLLARSLPPKQTKPIVSTQTNWFQTTTSNSLQQFSGSALDMGSTYSSGYTALHRVVASHIESSPKNFSQFR